MLPEIEQLLVIQDQDQKIKAHQIELNSVPLERQRVEQALKNRIEAFDQIKLRGKEIEVHRKKLELDANSRRDTITKYKIQQSQTRKNEEFQAIGQSISRLEHEIEQIEDEEIVLMEQGEVAPNGTTADRADQETRDIGATASRNRYRARNVGGRH